MLLYKMELQRRRRITSKTNAVTRKWGEQTGLDTPVVLTVNYEYQIAE